MYRNRNPKGIEIKSDLIADRVGLCTFCGAGIHGSLVLAVDVVCEGLVAGVILVQVWLGYNHRLS